MKTANAGPRQLKNIADTRATAAFLRILKSPPDESRESSVTLSWRVAWDEGEIARDLLQNFRDANKDRMHEISIAVDGDAVLVEGPAPCNIERLFYLGSDKDPDAGDIGRFGEGFKAAAVCLVRDHRIEPVFGSGKSLARIRAANQAAAEKLVPLIYDAWNLKEEIPGTRLWLRGCGPKLVRAMSAGLDQFFWPGNRLLGRQVWKAWKGDIALYEANGQDGSIFYRGLNRASIEGVPLVLVIDRPVTAIDNLARKDRDRQAFGTQIREKAYGAFVRSGLGRYHNTEAIDAILKTTKHLWQQGHPLLRLIADYCVIRESEHDLATMFGGPVFAAVPEESLRGGSVHGVSRVEILGREERWRKEGRTELPAYFARFGAPDALTELKHRVEREREQQRRAPTNAETRGIEVLRDATRDVAPDIAGLFARLKTQYTVAPNAEILGEFRKSRSYDSREVFLAAAVFESEFPEAFATFLHEHAHALGFDGDRAFTDALTQAIATLIRIRGRLDGPEGRWDLARKAVLAERKKSRQDGREDLASTLARLDESSLRALLSGIPAAVVEQALAQKKGRQGDEP